MTRYEFTSYLNRNNIRYDEFPMQMHTDMILVYTRKGPDRYVAVSNFGGKKVTMKTDAYRLKVDSTEVMRYINKNC